MGAMTGRLFAHYPTLNYLGMALWLGWSLVAFSGTFQFCEPADPHGPIGFFLLIQAGSLAVYLLAALSPDRAGRRLLAPGSQTAIALAASLITGCLALLEQLGASGSIGPGARSALFVVGGIALGAASGQQFLSCAIPFCSQTPQKATLRFIQALLQSGIYFFVLIGMPRAFSLVAFLITPLVIGVLQASQHQEPCRPVAPEAVETLNRPLLRLSLAMVVYAAAMRTFEPFFTAVTTGSGENISSPIAICILMLASIVIIVAIANLKGKFPYDRIYQATVSLLLFAVVLSVVFNSSPALVSIVCLVIIHFLSVLYRCMLAYIVFQSSANPIKVFGLGMAALSVGGIIGETLGRLLLVFGPATEPSPLLSLVLALACLIAALAIFPDSRMKTLLLPVEEPDLDVPEKKAARRPWMDSADSIAKAAGLSEREVDVFYEMVRGRTIQQIADKLFISPYTVKAHIRNIYAKLDVHSRNELNALVEKGATSTP